MVSDVETKNQEYIMKSIIISVLMLLAGAIAVNAAKSNVLEFDITGGTYGISPSVKRAMEENTVKLLTMLSDRQLAGSKTLDFSGISISPVAQTTIKQMWKYQPLRVWVDDGDELPLIQQNLLRIQGVNSYQIRNIPVRVFPNDTPGKNRKSEVAINFSPNGTIVDFNITIEKSQYENLLADAVSVQDVENRKMLAFWMDQLKMAYDSKDLPTLMKMYDKEATIVTGVRATRKANINPEALFVSNAKYNYYVKNYEQYMQSLKDVFKKNKNITVDFRDQEYGYNEIITMTDENGEVTPRYYMVWCTQDWKGTTYSDVGRLFLLWDFKNPDEPVILVRAWTEPDDPKQFSDQDFTLSLMR